MAESQQHAAPIVAMTMWRRNLPTYLGEHTDLFTLGTEYYHFFANTGVHVVLIPECTRGEASSLLSNVSGLVLTGGEDLGNWLATGEQNQAPHDATGRDVTETALLEEAQRRRLPVFGICRGMQLMAAVNGSRVVTLPAARDQHSYGAPAAQQLTERHDVQMMSTPTLNHTSPRLSVNSIHNQAISHCPDGFSVTAVADDGTIEAIAATGDWYAAGVQWHPEKMDIPGERESQATLIAPFLRAVRAFQATTTNKTQRN